MVISISRGEAEKTKHDLLGRGLNCSLKCPQNHAHNQRKDTPERMVEQRQKGKFLKLSGTDKIYIRRKAKPNKNQVIGSFRKLCRTF